MTITNVFENLYMADITPDGLSNPFISSYIFRGKDNIIVIEQGAKSSLKKLIEALEELGYTDEIIHLFVTHIHVDHAGSVGTMLNIYKNSYAYVHPKGVKHLLNPDKLWKSTLNALGWLAEIYQKPDPAPGYKIRITSDFQEIEIEGNRFIFLFTEGHASHHQSIFWKDKKTMFVGDSAGIYIQKLNYIIPTTLYPTKLDLYVKSLDKMIKYKPGYLMYPHFGVAKNGLEKLVKHREQVIKWFKLAKDNKPPNITEFKSLLKKEDEKLALLIEESESHPDLKVLLDMAILGILKETERVKAI